MMLFPGQLKWGSLFLALCSALSAAANLMCTGVDEGFCSTYNTYLIWVGAACATLAAIGILLRPSSQYYNAVIRFGLPTMAFLAAGFAWTTAGTNLSEDPPGWINWTNLILSVITLGLLGYDAFYFGIGTGAAMSTAVVGTGMTTGMGTGMGMGANPAYNTGYGTGQGYGGYDTGYY